MTASAPHTLMKNLTECYNVIVEVGSVAVIDIRFLLDAMAAMKGIVIYYGKPPALRDIDGMIEKALTPERLHVRAVRGHCGMITLAPS